MNKKFVTIAIGGAIVLVAAAILLPDFIRTRSHQAQNSCRNQLSLLNVILVDWAKKTGATNGTTVSIGELRAFAPKDFNVIGGCPESGSYLLLVGELPRCSIGGSDHTCPASHR